MAVKWGNILGPITTCSIALHRLLDNCNVHGMAYTGITGFGFNPFARIGKN